MKLVFTEQDVKDLVERNVIGLAPEGMTPQVEISAYSSDFVRVEFVPAVSMEKTEEKKSDDEIDLSEIPF